MCRVVCNPGDSGFRLVSVGSGGMAAEHQTRHVDRASGAPGVPCFQDSCVAGAAAISHSRCPRARPRRITHTLLSIGRFVSSRRPPARRHHSAVRARACSCRPQSAPLREPCGPPTGPNMIAHSATAGQGFVGFHCPETQDAPRLAAWEAHSCLLADRLWANKSSLRDCGRDSANTECRCRHCNPRSDWGTSCRCGPFR